MILVMCGQFDDACVDALSVEHDVVDLDTCSDARLLLKASVLIVRGHRRVDAALLDCMPVLQLVIKAGAGIDTVDVGELRRRRINLERVQRSTDSVAELTVLLLLAVSRRLRELMTSTQTGVWSDRYRCIGRTIAGGSLGVIGFGEIGRAVAVRAHAMGMRVRVFDRSPGSEEKRSILSAVNAEVLDLEPLLSTSSAVTLHLPLTEETAGVLGSRQLAAMQKDAVLINTARAHLVEYHALYASLRSGRIGGVGLDVHYSEPLRAEEPYLQMPNVICTPHVGAQTYQAHSSVGRGICEILRNYRNHASRCDTGRSQ